MHIPPKIRIPICIEQGSIFNFFVDFQNDKRESKNRYFVVVNSDPKNNKVLLLITPTTQIEKKQHFVDARGISRRTIVEIKAEEHPAFVKDCVFNCNEIFEVPLSALIKKIEEGGSMDFPKLTPHLLSRLIAGLKVSPLISDEHKELLGE